MTRWAGRAERPADVCPVRPADGTGSTPFGVWLGIGRASVFVSIHRPRQAALARHSDRPPDGGRRGVPCGLRAGKFFFFFFARP